MGSIVEKPLGATSTTELSIAGLLISTKRRLNTPDVAYRIYRVKTAMPNPAGGRSTTIAPESNGRPSIPTKRITLVKLGGITSTVGALVVGTAVVGTAVGAEVVGAVVGAGVVVTAVGEAVVGLLVGSVSMNGGETPVECVRSW